MPMNNSKWFPQLSKADTRISSLTSYPKESVMKITTEPLIDFINDFDLDTPDKGICFNATIHFSSQFLTLNLNSDVQIINIDALSMNVVYLFSHEIEKSGIPDMFEDHHEEITYLFKTCLIIKGHSLSFDNYVLTIHPMNSSCSEETLTKIHSKHLNSAR